MEHEYHDDLGPVQFVLRATWYDKLALWLLTGVFLIAPSFAIAWGTARVNLPLSIGFGLLGVAILTIPVYRQGASFCVHEKGVRRRSWFVMSRELPFEAVGRIRYTPPAVHYGVLMIGWIPIPTRTTVPGKLRLIPAPGEWGEAVGWTFVRADARLDALRDRLERRVARRLEDELKERGEVPWTRHVCLKSDGLELRARGFFGPREPVLVGYEEIALEKDQDRGRLLICDRAEDTILAEVPFAVLNFAPGYKLLSRLEIAARGGGGAKDAYRAPIPLDDGPEAPPYDLSGAIPLDGDLIPRPNAEVTPPTTIGTPEEIPERPRLPVHVCFVSLYQPDAVLNERIVAADEFAQYQKTVIRTLEDQAASLSRQAGQFGSVYGAVRPGRKSRFWLEFSPGGVPPEFQAALLFRLNNLPAPMVRGPVAFAVHALLWGGTGERASKFLSMPTRWSEALDGRGGTIPDAPLRKVWPVELS